MDSQPHDISKKREMKLKLFELYAISYKKELVLVPLTCHQSRQGICIGEAHHRLPFYSKGEWENYSTHLPMSVFL